MGRTRAGDGHIKAHQRGSTHQIVPAAPKRVGIMLLKAARSVGGVRRRCGVVAARHVVPDVAKIRELDPLQAAFCLLDGQHVCQDLRPRKS